MTSRASRRRSSAQVASLGTALAGAGIGAAAGGLVGALAGIGVPEEHAEYYAEGVRRGGTLITVHADDASAPDAARIMQQAGAIDAHAATGAAPLG